MSKCTAEVSAPRRAGAAQDSRRAVTPGTVMRADRFRELPPRLITVTRRDSHMLDMRPAQAVAARTAAHLACPRVRAALAARRSRIPTATVPRASRPARLLPECGAGIQGPAHEAWLAAEDAAALPSDPGGRAAATARAGEAGPAAERRLRLCRPAVAAGILPGAFRARTALAPRLAVPGAREAAGRG
jgi:hypothetical protein